MDLKLFLSAAVIAGTPLLLATLGEILTEKAGNLNLGIEGMMLMGAVMGFITAYHTQSPFLALAAAFLTGALGSLIYAFLTVTLRVNQQVSGLALTTFGTGFAGFLGQKYVGLLVPDNVKAALANVKIPLLGDIPFIGDILFNKDPIVYISYVIVIIIGIYLYKTRKGLNLIAVGENPAAADAAGINVNLYKYVHILIGGALCGLAGAYLSLIYVPAWQDNIVAGRGWIAVALVIFVTWNPYKAIAGSYLFGGLDILGFRLQKFELSIPQYFLDMLPYAATIIILIIASVKKSKKNLPPTSMGLPYFRENR
ncbi:MAG: ABC transporter permease [Clostridia bacterium]|jgi:ABC-type uncharacterized transport system permease subunit|nr:ABC transporter permease [Clostridiaceae bacterium]